MAFAVAPNGNGAFAGDVTGGNTQGMKCTWPKLARSADLGSGPPVLPRAKTARICGRCGAPVIYNPGGHALFRFQNRQIVPQQVLKAGLLIRGGKSARYTRAYETNLDRNHGDRDGFRRIQHLRLHSQLDRWRAAPLSTYKGKVVLVVNVAIKCGYTPQYAGLEKLYEKYKDKGFVIVGVPANNFGGQEPGTNEEIKTFCSRNYNVTFPMMSKVSVKGADKTPLYST